MDKNTFNFDRYWRGGGSNTQNFDRHWRRGQTQLQFDISGNTGIGIERHQLYVVLILQCLTLDINCYLLSPIHIIFLYRVPTNNF